MQRRIPKLYRSAVNYVAAITTGAFVALSSFGANMTDADVAHAVDDEITEDSATPANKITITAVDGVVTLTGSVDNLLAKDRAENIAATVRGVYAIINQIKVAPEPRLDAVIQHDVTDALLWNSATESWEIDPSVEDGEVTLTGSVDSYQEKTLAGKVAKGVKGVTAIDNQLTVDYDSARTDREIKEDVEAALRWDALVDSGLIRVTVKKADVTLAGTVGSLAEKRRAEHQSWVTGVNDVDNTSLKVRAWAEDKDQRKTEHVMRTDSQIEETIEDVLIDNPEVNSFNVIADASSGFVTLRGTVDNFQAKRAAAQATRNVLGVWGVDNKIKVRVEVVDPDRIKSRVSAALVRDPYVSRHDVEVTTNGTYVYLDGEVNSQFEKAQAEVVASSQTGVEHVYNGIAVNEIDTFAYNPYVDAVSPYDYRWYSTDDNKTSGTSDWQISEEIRDELFWSPFVDENEVVVTVDDGVATLSGTVDTWTERRAATENAFEGGAIVVDNDLAVSYGPSSYNP